MFERCQTNEMLYQYGIHTKKNVYPLKEEKNIL